MTYKCLAITSCVNYEWEQIATLVKSFKRNCQNHELIVLFYNKPTDRTISKLHEYHVRYLLVNSTRPDRIVVERFLAYHQLLSQSDCKYSVCVDASDIYFQEDPFVWLSKNIGDEKKVVVGSEQLFYKDEAWGNENLKLSFPDEYEKVKNYEIGNAGSIGGETSTLSDVCLKVYLMSKINSVFNPDQAALNVLMRTKDPQNFYFTRPEDGWSYQCGTSANDIRGDHPQYNFNSFLIGAPPRILNSKVINEKDEPVCIVHQYQHSRRICDLIHSNNVGE